MQHDTVRHADRSSCLPSLNDLQSRFRFLMIAFGATVELCFSSAVVMCASSVHATQKSSVVSHDELCCLAAEGGGQSQSGGVRTTGADPVEPSGPDGAFPR